MKAMPNYIILALLICIAIYFTLGTGTEAKDTNVAQKTAPDIRLVIPLKIKDLSKHATGLHVTCYVYSTETATGYFLEYGKTSALLTTRDFDRTIAVNIFLKENISIENLKSYVCQVYVHERDRSKMVVVGPNPSLQKKRYYILKDGSPTYEKGGKTYLGYIGKL